MASLNGTRSDAGGGLPGGYEPPLQEMGPRGGGGGGGGTTAAVSQLFARLTQEIEEQRPKNAIHFIVDFLCKHYPEHLHGFASIWQMDPDLERERHEVVNFFKAHKISTAVAAHFTNAGFDTLDTLTTLSPDSLVDVEAFNNVKWLPGHKVRLQQIFGEISARVRAYRQQYLENPQRKHQHHKHHHHRHHVHDRHDSPPPGPTYHRSEHASSSGHSYAPAAIANHAAPVSHHAPVVHHVSHPDAMVHQISHAPAVREVVHHVASSAPQAYHAAGGIAGGHAAHVSIPAPLGGGGISSLSPGINPSNNIFLQNLPPPQF